MSETTTGEDSESSYFHHEALGAYINQFRLYLHVSISQLCTDCHFSRRTYYDIKTVRT